jgi:hypothetical protein
MSKFANATRTLGAAGITSPVTATTDPATRTHEGGHGSVRDAKSELFLLAAANKVSEDTFYEAGAVRDSRFVDLARQVTREDPEWVARFVPWLRAELNMRSAAVVLAAETVRERLTTQIVSDTTNRKIIASALQRPDEPAEMLAYWTNRYGRAVPKPVKRGVADAVARMFTERAALKYDGTGGKWRMGDVVELVHPEPTDPSQAALFRYLLDRRHHAGDVRIEAGSLPAVEFRQWLESIPAEHRRDILRENGRGPSGALGHAGATWEWLSGWIPGGMDAEAWSWVIPSMGTMALVRNLRNFDQAGVPDDIAEQVAARICDPDEVRRSRQFPFRYYAAHTAVGSLRWGHALEKALTASLTNVPALPGRTLICVDQSPSMFPGYHYSTSNRSDISLADQAKLFGAAVAVRAESADLVGYGFTHYRVPVGKGDAVLAVMGRFRMDSGTDTPRAIVENYQGHDRVIVITDEQTALSQSGSSVDSAVPAGVPMYTWNVGGYRPGHGAAGAENRHTFGGLTDAAFRLIPLIERARSQDWPFMS